MEEYYSSVSREHLMNDLGKAGFKVKNKTKGE